MKSRTLRVLAGLGAVGAVLLLGIIYAFLSAYVYLAPSLPSSAGMRTLPLQVPLRVYTRSGALISQIGEQRRVPISYDEIPQLVREAFLAAEDDRFFQHGGIDYFSVLRSIYVDLTTGDYAQGASTITMQTARNLFLWPGGGFVRKAIEAPLALAIDLAWPKRRILEVYLNAIEWGHGIYGAEAAARATFLVGADALSGRQATLLAAVLPSPLRWSANPPSDYVARRASTISARVANMDGFFGCIAK